MLHIERYEKILVSKSVELSNKSKSVGYLSVLKKETAKLSSLAYLIAGHGTRLGNDVRLSPLNFTPLTFPPGTLPINMNLQL